MWTGGRGGRRRSGYSTKNKNPTLQCGKKHKVLCSGFLPKTKPMQHSCSHYNAFCSITWLTTHMATPDDNNHVAICSHSTCDLQPQIAKHSITTHPQAYPKQLEATVTLPQKKANRPQPHPPHTGGTFHRRLQPLYMEKLQVFVLRLPPQNKAHATFMQPLQCVLQHHVANYTHGNTR